MPLLDKIDVFYWSLPEIEDLLLFNILLYKILYPIHHVIYVLFYYYQNINQLTKLYN